MNRASAGFYINSYLMLIRGKLFSRTTNRYATEYFLQRIYDEEGSEGLQNALLSLDKHINYYENKSGSSAKSNREIYQRFLSLINNELKLTPVYPDEVDSELKYSEGKVIEVRVNGYERNIIARLKCIQHFGATCQVCGFNFEERFGEIGKDFIHVHHLKEISSIGKEYEVNPIKDLAPVCPNCHAMLHKRRPAFTIEELKVIIQTNQNITNQHS